jgi:hypothetical protein
VAAARVMAARGRHSMHGAGTVHDCFIARPRLRKP